MFFVAIRKNARRFRRRNFEFLPSRSDIYLPRSNFEIRHLTALKTSDHDHIHLVVRLLGMDKVNPHDLKVKVKITKVVSVFSATAWVTTRSGNVSRRETSLSSDRLTL